MDCFFQKSDPSPFFCRFFFGLFFLAFHNQSYYFDPMNLRKEDFYTSYPLVILNLHLFSLMRCFVLLVLEHEQVAISLILIYLNQLNCSPLPLNRSNTIGIPIDARIVPHPAPICLFVGFICTLDPVCKALRISQGQAWLSWLVRGFRSKRSLVRFSVTSTSVSTFL